MFSLIIKFSPFKFVTLSFGLKMSFSIFLFTNIKIISSSYELVKVSKLLSEIWYCSSSLELSTLLKKAILTWKTLRNLNTA